MSRTDRHVPFVALAYREGGLREEHDHREGPCDLPDREVWLSELRAVRQPWRLYGRYRCVWEVVMPPGTPFCGCALCSGVFEKERPSRVARRAGVREVRAQLDEVEGDVGSGG